MLHIKDDSDLDRLIVANQKLEAVALIRKKKSCGIPEAIDILTHRYRALREESPEQFLITDEEYWRGFQS